MVAVQSFLLKQVKEQSIHVWHDRMCGLVLRCWVGMMGIGGIVLLVTYRRLPPEIPLWFSRPWGELQLARKEWLWMLPGSLGLIGLVALITAGMAYREEKLLARIIMGGGGVIGFLLTYALLRIINLAI